MFAPWGGTEIVTHAAFCDTLGARVQEYHNRNRWVCCPESTDTHYEAVDLEGGTWLELARAFEAAASAAGIFEAAASAAGIFRRERRRTGSDVTSGAVSETVPDTAEVAETVLVGPHVPLEFK